ncbi:MAG: M23 family metallopeptidase [Bacteroidetes bacterium]|nr:M23 family metallopeptidase [Bacteroidota bacterium]
MTAVLFLFICTSSHAQKFNKNYFRNPLDIPIQLAGSFGELRFNHFHTGLDIRTKGQEGLPVYAAADGWISRINISAYGYGNLLFISHTNGYTTVYAHLQRFAPNIKIYVREQQYKLESFEVDLHPNQQKFHVKKGELIGYSGNTGGSKAPHLHFEIRETMTEAPVNPMLFLSDEIKDTLPPVISGLKLYPLDSNSFIKAGGRVVGFGDGLKLDVYKRNGQYALQSGLKIEAKGNIGVGIKTVDYATDYANFIAPYSVEMCIDKDRKFYQCMEKLEFGKLRYINAHTDYEEYIKNSSWYERMYQLPNDSQSYYGVKGNGKINISANQTEVFFTVKDLHNLQAKLVFNIFKSKLDLHPKNRIDKKKITDTFLNCREENILKQEGFYLKIPKNVLYDDAIISLKQNPKVAKSYSPLFIAGDATVPIHSECEVGIKITNIPENLKDKVGILCASRGFLDAHLKDDWLIAKTRYLGGFCVMADITPPSVRSLTLLPGGSLGYKKLISFKIGDDLSGVKSFRGEIDGKWVLFEYEGKSSVLSHTIDKPYEHGMHTLKLVVTDGKNNVNTVEMNFRM